MSRLYTLFLSLCALWVLGFALLFVFQRSFIYMNGDARIPPADLGATEFSEKTVPSDGVDVVVWTHDAGADTPVIIYFHGNAGVLADRAWRFRWMAEQGWSVVGVGLRGGSGTGGTPTEAALAADARAVHDALPSLFGRAVSAEDIVPYGESLGTGVAVTLATERSVGAVILETPYTAIEDRAQEIYRIFPVKLFGAVKDKFRSIDRIAEINAPLLILHGTADPVIPMAHGQRLFAAAVEPKTARWFEGGGHNDLWQRGAQQEIARFVSEWMR
jgi:fermentation-respiration switch protein FrsA (DUF1100 family)